MDILLLLGPLFEEALILDKGGGGGWKQRVERVKWISWVSKTYNSSSKGDNKEHFDAKPKAGDGGDILFVMRRKRCGQQPAAACPLTTNRCWIS